MCLFTSQKEPLISDEDIKCYKIVKVTKDGLFSPYRNFTITPNIPMEDTSEEHMCELFGLMEITSGFFHSITTKEAVLKLEAELKRQTLKFKKKPEFKICEAIIPKGTPYYVGQRSDICSKTLVIMM